MNMLDLIIIVIIATFALWGYVRGFLLMLGGVVVSMLAGLVASRLGELIADAITGSWNGLEMASRVAVVHQILFWLIFIVAFVVGNIALRLINFLTEIPIVGSVKHVGGLLLGLVLGFLVAGFFVVMLDTYPIYEGWGSLAEQSKLVQPLMQLLSFSFGFWPKSLQDVAGMLRSKAGS